MSLLQFTKMQGAGNDYIYINTFDEAVSNHPALSNLPELAIKLSNRNFGIGGDGIVLISPSEDSEDADLQMRMFNADGSESEMCGNAIRCVGKYAYEHGLVEDTIISVATGAGIKTLRLSLGSNKDATSGDSSKEEVATIGVFMGIPELKAENIPSTLSEDKVLDHEFDFGDFTQTGTLVSMGNPHFVTFIQDTTNLAIRDFGPVIENANFFPNRINTEFVEVLSRTEVNQRTWERGSGETLACGTGASAVVVAGILTNRLDNDVWVNLRGGRLRIQWKGEGEDLLMIGNAKEVYTGEIDPDLIQIPPLLKAGH